MNVWENYTRRVVCVVSVIWPLAIHADGFDGYIVTDQAEQLVSVASDLESKPRADLVGESILVQPEEVLGELFDANPTLDMGMASDEALGFDGDEGSNAPFLAASSGSPSGSYQEDADTSYCVDSGAFNRILGDACPRWVAQIDALMLWQGAIASRPLLANAGGATVLDANQAQTIMSVGPRYALFLNLDQCYSIEGNYFNVGSFAGTAPQVPAGVYTGITLPGSIPTSATPFQLLTNGEITSAELNWRRRAEAITWLAGFRWVEWNQQFQLVDSVTAPTAGTTAVTGNDLYGGQAGMDIMLWNNGGPIKVNGVGKAGVFYNTAYQRTNSGKGNDFLGSGTAEQTSFFGEVGANGSVRLTDWLSWRAGYSLFWLSGVAVPADQLTAVALAPTPSTPTINTNGSVLLHGVTTGLEARW